MELLSSADLVTINAPFFFFEIIISLLSMQLVKFDAVSSLYALLDSKKTYVRYVVDISTLPESPPCPHSPLIVSPAGAGTSATSCGRP